jgi:hypothetical protein
MANEFLNKENIEMIWELILDENLINNLNQNQSYYKQIFLDECKKFYDRERFNHPSLLSINKVFITEIIIILNNINVSNNNPITYQEIKNNKISSFDRELEQKKNDFTNLMTINIPEKPKFNIDISDEPISEMEELIKRTLEQRNFDIERIQENLNKDVNADFLKSQETSIKTEKITKGILKNEGIKYIKIDKTPLDKRDNGFDVIDLNNKKKNISWSDNEIKENNIFSKLKQLNNENNKERELMSFLINKFDELNLKIDNINTLIKSKNN